MKIIEVTSSTAHAKRADATDVINMNFFPLILGIDTISCTIQVKNPRSLSAPTMIIIPTRKSITGSSDDVTKLSSVSDFVNINTASPINAIASLKFQKKRVPRIIERKTEHETDCRPDNTSEK